MLLWQEANKLISPSITAYLVAHTGVQIADTSVGGCCRTEGLDFLLILNFVFRVPYIAGSWIYMVYAPSNRPGILCIRYLNMSSEMKTCPLLFFSYFSTRQRNVFLS